MKAAVYSKYGPPEVLSIQKVEKPSPKPDEILVKIHSATVTSGDARLRASDFPALFWLPARLIFGLFSPEKKILGHEFAGTIEAVGHEITEYKPGDRVFGTTTMRPGGSYAEYVCVPNKWKHGVVTHMPEQLSFEEAAAIPIGAMTAQFLLDKAKLKEGMKVLVYGASGSVGTYALQIAKANGCEVTAVASGGNLEMLQELGADHTLNYKTTDYTKTESSYDIIFDAVGKTSKSIAKKVLKEQGAFVSVAMMTSERQEDIERLKSLIDQGKLKAYIDRTYPLDEIVEAHKYVDSGRKRGNITIAVGD